MERVEPLFLFGKGTSETRADRGAESALAKGRSRSCTCKALDRAVVSSWVLPGALKQAELLGNTPGLCSK